MDEPVASENGPGKAAGFGPRFGLSFGELLLERGLVSAADLERCVALQRDRARSGVFVRLGEILVEEGVLRPQDVADVLENQNLSILACEKCFTQFNVERYDPATQAFCRRCRGRLVPPTLLTRVEVEDTVASAKESPSDAAERKASSLGKLRASAPVAQLGPYEIVGEISRGGMSVVYKARQAGLDRFVALKVLLSMDQASAEDVERFKLEARAVSRLRHPNIVGIFEVSEINGILFFTMDYIEGTTLDRAVVLDSLSTRDVAEIFRKLAEALVYSHSRGVLHRDIKPKNILVDRNGEPVIIDFGIAKELDAAELLSSAEGQLLGSPAYLAPEYLSGEHVFDVRCEVYALGTSLYQVLSGRNPNDDVNTRAIIANALVRRPPPLRTVAPGVPWDLAHITMTALAADPQRRYATPAALAADLRRFLDGEEILAVASPLMVWWRLVRIKVVAVLVGLLSLILVFTSGYYARRVSATDRSRQELEDEIAEVRAETLRAQLRVVDLLVERERFSEASAELDRLLRRFPKETPKAALKLKQRIVEALKAPPPGRD